MKIYEKTVYMVDDVDFETRYAAEEYILFQELMAKITVSGHGSLEERIRNSPRYTLEMLQEYVRKLDKLEAEATASLVPVPARKPSVPGSTVISVANFCYQYAKEAGRTEGYTVSNVAELTDAVIALVKAEKKLSAIKLVRSCFFQTPTLQEAKNWVESRWFQA